VNWLDAAPSLSPGVLFCSKPWLKPSREPFQPFDCASTDQVPWASASWLEIGSRAAIPQEARIYIAIFTKELNYVISLSCHKDDDLTLQTCFRGKRTSEQQRTWNSRF
jgi:hypothetical protein